MSAKWQSRTKNTPRYAAWAASDAAQSILQHRASPRRAGSPHSGAMPPARQHCRLVFCFPWAHAYIHTHTHTQQETCRQKQSRRSNRASTKSTPVPFIPRQRGHLLTVSPRKRPRRDGRNCCMSWMGLPRLLTANAHAPWLQKSLLSKSH